MPSSKVAYSVEDGLARIVFTDVENNNAIDLQVCKEFGEAATAARKDESVKAVLLQAQGDVFSVGGDIKGFIDNKDKIYDHVISMTNGFHAGVRNLRDGVPFIVAVNGMAAGGAFSLVCAADLAIAKRSAKFCAAYTKTGLSPDGGGTYFLPRIVGRQRAFDIFATNPVLSADEARDLGIVTRVIDDEKFEAEVETLARKVANSPPGALAALKKLLNASLDSSLEDQLNAEAQSIATLTTTPSTMERLIAFMARAKT